MSGVRAYSYSFTHIRPGGPEMFVGKLIRAGRFRRTMGPGRNRLAERRFIFEDETAKGLGGTSHTPCFVSYSYRNLDRIVAVYRIVGDHVGRVVVTDTTHVESCRRSIVADRRSRKATSYAGAASRRRSRKQD